MPTLREVRARISGVKKTQKITKAMKMVAAAKLRRAQNAVVSARPYARKLQELLAHLSASVETTSNPLMASREVRGAALIVVTSDRGLCGAFNSNLLRTTVSHIQQNYAELHDRKTLKVFCVGKKGFDFLTRRRYNIGGKYVGLFNNLMFGQAQMIAREVVDGYLRGEFDRVEIVYNEFKSIAVQRIVIEQFLPIATGGAGEVQETTHGPPPTFYLYEPSAAQILEGLVPKHLNFHIWRALLESNAAEQGARMAAMDKATENANELISTLQLAYNKARQASITKELLEVVSGAEALKKAG